MQSLSGYIYIAKLIRLRKQFLALWPWDITRIFCVFKVIIKWDNLKKMSNLYCSLPERVSRSPEHDAKSMRCLPSSLSWGCVLVFAGTGPAGIMSEVCPRLKEACLGTIYFMFSAWSEPWSKLLCQLCLGFLLKETSLLIQKGAWKGPGIPALRITKAGEFTHLTA